MQFKVVQSETVAKRAAIQVEHDNVRIAFEVGKDFNDLNNDIGLNQTFRYLNQFIMSWPKYKQDELFARYNFALTIFGNSQLDIKPTEVALMPHVRAILDLFELEGLEQWLLISTDIIIPADLRKDFQTETDAGVKFSSDDDGGRIETRRTIGTPDKTYLRRDYIKLVTLLIAFRAVLPIWTQYLTIFGEVVALKELRALGLTAGSAQYESEAIERLLRYVNAAIDEDDNLASAILGGVSRDDFPTWLMAQAIVRKLIMVDLSGIPRKDDQGRTKGPALLSALHQSVDSRVERYPAQFSGQVSEKKPLGEDPNDNRYSLFESTRTREPRAKGEILAVELPLLEPHEFVRRYYPYVPIDLLDMTLRATASFNQPVDLTEFAGDGDFLGEPTVSPVLQAAIVAKWQLVITDAVLKGTYYPRSTSIISRHPMGNALAIAAAVLITKGYPDIAVMLMATDTQIMQYGKSNPERFSKEMTDELTRVYPYLYQGNSKKEKQANVGIVGINTIVTDMVGVCLINNLRLECHIPSDLEQYLPRVIGRKIAPNPHLRNRLAKLFVQLADEKVQ